MDDSTLGNSRHSAVCCIPSSDSGNAESAVHHRYACQYLCAHADSIGGDYGSSSMTIQSGPHGHHAVSSRDIKAGSVIVQCLSLAHSILVPPGTLMGGDDDNDDCGGRKRCARCFFREGDEDSSGKRRKKFGRCSKCRIAYYCSRSCQVKWMSWCKAHLG